MRSNGTVMPSVERMNSISLDSRLNVLSTIRIAAPELLAVALSANASGQPKPLPLVSAHEAVRRIMANDPEMKIELAEQTHAEHLTKFASLPVPTECLKKVARIWDAANRTAIPSVSFINSGECHRANPGSARTVSVNGTGVESRAAQNFCRKTETRVH